jgi:two-component sensor histidine kinase
VHEDGVKPREAFVVSPAPAPALQVTELLDTIRQLSSARSQEEIMAAVSQGVRRLLQADGATFVLRDGDRCYYAEEDAISPLWKGRRFAFGDCISGWCMLNRQAVAVPDIYEDPRIPADTYRPTFVRSLAMAPVGRDEPIAAVGAYWSEQRQPQGVELDILQSLADAAALAVANLELRRGGAPEPPHPSARPAEDPPRLGRPRSRARRWSLRRHFEQLARNDFRPNSLGPYVFAIGGVLIATLARFGVEATGAKGLCIFSTYYPVVLLSMLVGGRRVGVLAAALGGLAAYYFFLPPLFKVGLLNMSGFIDLTIYVIACGLITLIMHRYQHVIGRLVHEDARHLTLAREQHHRVRNALSIVEMVVHQSLRDSPERARTINRRIRASLPKVEMGDAAVEGPTSLRAFIQTELQPHDLTRFTLEGDDVMLTAAEARNLLSLAMHELTTNALKYGALSTPNGRVRVAWRRLGDKAAINWTEDGGPVVLPPKGRGYGTILLRRLINAAGGALKIDYRPDGLTAEISLGLRA